MQARRRAQPSGTNSPSSSHPRLKAPSAMRDLHPCPPCGRQGRPGQGFLAGFIERPRGSAPRERDHRGGDHPVPSRTRQLSPPSPRVLQRKAAGGQGVALAEGAFLYAHGAASPRRKRGRRAGRGPQGGCPLRAFCALGLRAAQGTLRFRGAGALHCRRDLAASPGKPSKSLLLSRSRSTADGRESRTAAYRAP